MADKKLTNIEIYRKKWNLNIGILIFGVIFIYLVVTVLMYLTGNHVTIYEVREGSIQKDNAYTGLILRDETVVQADAEGYVNYFALEGSKVGAQTRVYSLSPDELTFSDPSASSEEAQALTAEEQSAILQQTQNFSDSFRDENFEDVYSLRDSISTVLDSKSSQSRQAQLEAMVASGTSGLQVYSASSDGIIVFSTDGYEDVTIDDVTEEMLNRADYEKVSLQDNAQVNSGDPVYKLVRSDIWNIIIQLDDTTAESLADTSSVNIEFSKDNKTATAGFELRKSKDLNLGILTLDSSMIRYVTDRYVDIELILEDQSGLKIPKSSVIEREFYTVPEDYMTQGGNSNETGVLIDDGSDSAKFQEAEVYYRDHEAGVVYLDMDLFDKGTVLRKEDSDNTYTLKDTKSLQGVYNINKGYAEFREVTILSESDEYYIVESGNEYGLSNYDHIALSGKGIRENDVVF
nr:HlyD family efflux transporter periplasmic adaptor subunit [uncultured Merdimonas sp.]